MGGAFRALLPRCACFFALLSRYVPEARTGRSFQTADFCRTRQRYALPCRSLGFTLKRACMAIGVAGGGGGGGGDRC